MIEYIGKAVLVTEGKERVLALADIHAGYDESLRRAGVFVPPVTFKTIINDLKELFDKVGNVDCVVIVGDLKHAFGAMAFEEKSQIGTILETIKCSSKKIVVIRGNHDVAIDSVIGDYNLQGVDFYCWKGYCFTHGNKDFEILHEKEVHTWILGHLHPAITLFDGARQETYKCFLEGIYQKKKVIILPSFFPGIEGSDPRGGEERTPWSLYYPNFEVNVIGENLKVLSFGKLKDVPEC